MIYLKACKTKIGITPICIVILVISLDCLFIISYLADHRTTGYKVSVHSTWAKTKLQTPLIFWSHWCFTFEESSDSWVIYKNGILGNVITRDILDGDFHYLAGYQII